MVKYSRTRLAGYADSLSAYAALTVFGNALMFGGAYAAYAFIRFFLTAVLQGFLHKVTPASTSPGPVLLIFFFWCFIGVLVGLAKTGKSRANAQMILCSIEQEMHLAKIAELLQKREQWTPAPPPTATAFPPRD